MELPADIVNGFLHVAERGQLHVIHGIRIFPSGKMGSEAVHIEYQPDPILPVRHRGPFRKSRHLKLDLFPFRKLQNDLVSNLISQPFF